MKKIYISIALLICLAGLKRLHADTRIILYLKHAPENALKGAEIDAKKEHLLEKLDQMDKKRPSENAKKNIRNHWHNLVTPKLSGFIALHNGYWDYSDMDGLISFPLRHSTPKVYLAITPKILLAQIKGNTFSHSEFIGGNIPAKLYQFEKKLDDKKNRYWQISELKLPADKKINPLTMVILSNPDNIFVPIGDFMSNENIQIVLPNIYVIGNTDAEKIILDALDITRFFDHINFNNKKVNDFMLQKIISNL